MGFEYIAAEVWAWGSMQVIVMLIGCIAAACALLLSRRAGLMPTRWARTLATIGLLAPFLVLVLTMFGLADMHRQMLEIQEFLPSTSPPVPRDQRSTVLAHVHSFTPVLLGQLVAVMLPVVTWVWIRVHRPGPAHRWLHALALTAAGVITIALWAASRWANEWIFQWGFINISGCGRYFGRPSIDSSFESLDQLRTLVVLAGVSLGVAAVWCAIVQTRRGLRLGTREWVALLGLVGAAGAAMLWTLDERRDTRAYIRFGEHDGFGRDSDLIVGPSLDQCMSDWTGSEIIFVAADPEQRSVEQLVEDVEFIEICDGPNGIIAILADPTVEITRVAAVLQAIKTRGWRVGVMSLRPSLASRETTGEFIRHRSCLVEFALGPKGVPLDRFSTWGELAAAADAAGGTLVINPAP